MIKIFFDIERYKKDREKPFLSEKIIAIGYVVIKNFKHLLAKVDEYPRISLLTEWKEGNEKAVISKFYNLIRRYSQSTRVELIGFGILKFDIPILIQRIVELGLASLPEANKSLFSECVIFDLHPISVLLNQLKYKGSGLDKLVGRLPFEDKKMPKVLSYENGGIVHDLYERQDYNKIEEHLKEDVKKTIWLYKILQDKVVPLLAQNIKMNEY